MNEPTPAPLRPRVPLAERIAAGVLAGAWVVWILCFSGGVVKWGEHGVNSLGNLLNDWQNVIFHDAARAYLQPGSSHFATVTGTLFAACSALGSVWLIVAGLCLYYGRGGRCLRRFFWLSVAGHGAAGLGSLAAEGRFQHLFDYGSAHWSAGWLDRILRPNPGTELWHWAISLIEILLGGLILWLGWRRGWWRKAGNALATEGAERAGSRV